MTLKQRIAMLAKSRVVNRVVHRSNYVYGTERTYLFLRDWDSTDAFCAATRVYVDHLRECITVDWPETPQGMIAPRDFLDSIQRVRRLWGLTGEPCNPYIPNRDVVQANCLVVDANGFAERSKVLIDERGPIYYTGDWDEHYQRVGEREAAGWGTSRSGPAYVYQLEGSEDEVVIPIAEVERAQQILGGAQ